MKNVQHVLLQCLKWAKLKDEIYKTKFVIDKKKFSNNSTLVRLITAFVIKSNLLSQFCNCTMKLSKLQITKSSISRQTLNEFSEITNLDSAFSKYVSWSNLEWMSKDETMKISSHMHTVIDAIENVKNFCTSFSSGKWLKKLELKLNQKTKWRFSNTFE